MSRTSKTILAFVTIHLIAAVTGQELEKRSPMGFLGVRGKKYYDVPEFFKRKPQFFVGVKGKKSIYDLFESPELYFKRAPMGFMGMRGKKDQFYDEKRAMGFVGMRGKKEMYSDEEKQAPVDFGLGDKRDMYLDEQKRAPMGFVGMRGKKELFESDYSPDGYEYVPKQGSLIGQIDYNSIPETDNTYPLIHDILTQYLKSLEHADSLESATEVSEPIDGTNEVEKRAANVHQFFGVRGKKSMQDKRPYDVSFRGKFIGVRGKKDMKNSEAQEIKFLLNQGSLPKRKGSMGFIGMRGKKWDDESSPETETLN